MTYLLFTGDLLVMAFMMGLVVWVYMKSSKQTIKESARIPLEDEIFPVEADNGEPDKNG